LRDENGLPVSSRMAWPDQAAWRRFSGLVRAATVSQGRDGPRVDDLAQGRRATSPTTGVVRVVEATRDQGGGQHCGSKPAAVLAPGSGPDGWRQGPENAQGPDQGRDLRTTPASTGAARRSYHYWFLCGLLVERAAMNLPNRRRGRWHGGSISSASLWPRAWRRACLGIIGERQDRTDAIRVANIEEGRVIGVGVEELLDVGSGLVRAGRT